MLENMFVSNCPSIGSLKKALSGLVLHFGGSGSSSLPSEVAWLSTTSRPDITPPAVRVFVSHSSLKTMRAVYAPLGKRVTVEPLYFSEAELDAPAFLSMMAVGSSDSVPLYVQTVLVRIIIWFTQPRLISTQTILRKLGENYTYEAFMIALEDSKKDFNPAQQSGLKQRMSLLTSFLDKNQKRRPTASRFAAGQLTIVDLTDPFIDPSCACGLFEIITRLFVRSKVGTGKVLVVDEAHKVCENILSNTTELIIPL